jgi:rare lipoprotein A
MLASRGWGRAMGQSRHWRGWARTAQCAAAAVGCLGLAQCGSQDLLSRKVDPKYGVSSSPRVVDYVDPVPKGGGTYRIGKPYMVAGVTYVPEENPNYRAEGLASYYGQDFHGRLTANGEVFDMDGLSAAHPTLPIPCYARVTNLSNHKSVIVRVNDRGPYHGNRIIDVSMKTAHVLGFHQHGVARVKVEYAGAASLDGSDDRLLLATLREGEPAPAPSRVMLASSRPFLPSSKPAILGTVPLPVGRPFNLGEQEEDVVPSPPASRSAAARPAKPPVQTARFDPSMQPRSLQDQARDLAAAERTGPISAYAPVREGYSQLPDVQSRSLQ